jgi:hypothetical protein
MLYIDEETLNRTSGTMRTNIRLRKTSPIGFTTAVASPKKIPHSPPIRMLQRRISVKA